MTTLSLPSSPLSILQNQASESHLTKLRSYSTRGRQVNGLTSKAPRPLLALLRPSQQPRSLTRFLTPLREKRRHQHTQPLREPDQRTGILLSMRKMLRTTKMALIASSRSSTKMPIQILGVQWWRVTRRVMVLLWVLIGRMSARRRSRLALLRALRPRNGRSKFFHQRFFAVKSLGLRYFDVSDWLSAWVHLLLRHREGVFRVE